MWAVFGVRLLTVVLVGFAAALARGGAAFLDPALHVAGHAAPPADARGGRGDGERQQSLSTWFFS